MINTYLVDHYREAERFTESATDHYAESNRAGRPAPERAEAARVCRLLSGLAFAHGVLAVADAARQLVGPAAELDQVDRVDHEQPAGREHVIAAHLERMAERYPAAVFTEDGHAPDAVAGTALRTVLTNEAARLREEAS